MIPETLTDGALPAPTSPATSLMTQSPPRMGDLIALRDFPAVVHGADVRSLRFGEENQAQKAARREFLQGYLGHDERARHALDVLLHALSLRESGAAFFVNGVFGSGKSHLLGLLALLGDGIGHDEFLAVQPHYAAPLRAMAPRFVVHVSLDEYDASRFSLEEIFWREARAEWSRRGCAVEELLLPLSGSRAETMLALHAALAARQWGGMLLCFDELSLFLAAREHRALQGDAAFLQFLGQHARRQPLVVAAALQKTVEDVGALEAYSLSQIRDRFSVLPLSLAHLPSLIERRLVVRRDEEALRRVAQESFETLSRALPRLDCGRAEWEALYPFHPPIVSLLEGAVSRFFSRTRSAALFCAGSVNLEDKATSRVGCAALFAYLEPEMEGHPELRPLGTVWREWQEQLAHFGLDTRDEAALRRLMQASILFKIAGQAPSVVQLANAAALDAGLPGEGNYEYARALLERLRTRGSYLAVERAENAGDPLGDRYTIDLGLRVGEMARRHVRGVLDSLEAGDARIAHYVIACCRGGNLPLATLESNAVATVLWRNTPRRFSLNVVGSSPTAAQVVNRVMALGQPGHETDALLLLSPPFAAAPQRARALFDEAVRALGEGHSEGHGESGAAHSAARWRAALLFWAPRRPTPDEWEIAREATAQHLLENDPQLLDNKRGRAILAHLKNGAAPRETQLAHLAFRLLREGQIVCGNGRAAEAGEILTGESWTALLEALADFSLPEVFPLFESIAPRLRVLTPSNAEALCLDVLRRPANAPFFSASLERAARAIAEPLGIARADAGRWKIAEGRDDLRAAIEQLCAEGAPLAHLEAVLAKSEWGLCAEQTHIAVCALLRGGQLVAADARGQILAPPQIGMPLSRSVRTLHPGQLLPSEAWPRLRRLVALLTNEQLGALSFAEQEKARALLAAWRESAVGETELAQARLHQLRRVCNHTLAQWPRTRAAWEQIEILLGALLPGGGVLERAASLNLETLEPALTEWRRVVTRLDERLAALLEMHTALTHPALCVPPGLQAERAALLTRFDAGEELLDDETLIAEAQKWRAAYAAHYREWHGVQHAAARFAPYKNLLAGDALRALDRLANLQVRPFGQARALREAAQSEWVKACGQEGAPPAGEVVCPHCRLRWGERLILRDPREIRALGDGGVAAFRLALREPAVESYLRRHAAGQTLLAWNEGDDGEAESLLPLLTDEALTLLNEALRPRRRVTRSREALQNALADCRTRREFTEAFAQWLDGGEHLCDSDEIEMLS